MEPQSKRHEVKTKFNTTLPSSSSSSSSSSSPSQDYDDLKIREDEVNKKETTTTSTKEGDEDDGYQTPTSPRHRIPIPPLLNCPKAPMKKKPSCRRRVMKRGREFWGCFEIVNVVEIGDHELGCLKTNKVRRVKQPLPTRVWVCDERSTC